MHTRLNAAAASALIGLTTCLLSVAPAAAQTTAADPQYAPAQTAATPSAQPTAAPATQNTQTVVVAPAPAPTDTNEPAPAINDDPVRFRFGIALDGNLMFANNLVGLGIGLTVRAGVQFNQWVGLYYQPHGIVGGWLTDQAVGVIGALYNSMNVELTLPFLHIGAGPSVDVLGVAGCGGDGGGSAGCVSGDAVFFGIDSRVALVIGAIGRGSRGGFSINAHVHPTFVGDSVVTTVTLGVGGEVY